ncbi:MULTISPECIES: MATE family efflux transporter [Caproicibacterium]|jgi:putative MATE family efflux protein|uniref:MATE family efflux transporter n=1 Tax=Caproicibacterium lactatifermentans TaxID=2666138 RepID=A0A859DR82_9FIRM|nr:MATE family efflux transporter [Caproicibacterium lactatifermentans]ARP50313.1 MATE family efflux transporter [Ruminococcaceae bacterium CPB6]QKN23965.1 MATE family efflux transporter [Caproicibacterium lactatifermentans]QKO30963.1 MATE family efflux transporter [Caproicibacterium lactatifermentans]
METAVKQIESKQTPQPNRMGVQKMVPLVISMSLPTIFSMLVQALYNIVDSIFVSRINESAITAVSLVFPIQNLLIAVCIGTGIGMNSLIARRLGEKKIKEANLAADHGVLLSALNYVFFLLLGLFAAAPFAHSFTKNPQILKWAVQYMQIVCIGSFSFCFEANLEKVIGATGNMVYPMIFQLTGAVANIILDPIFIFTLHMDVAGAAIATIIGQFLSLLVAVYVIRHKKMEVHISLRDFHFSWQTIRDIYTVGLPSIVMNAIGSVMTSGLNAILITFKDIGNTAVAVFGVYFKLQMFVFMPVFGLNQGIIPIMGYNYGAHNKRRLNSCLRIGIVIAVCIMLFGMTLFMAIPGQLLKIFDASPSMLSMGIPALRTISLCFLPAALGILLSAEFTAVGKGTYSLIVTLMRQLCVLLPAAAILAQVTGRVNAVWFAFPIAEVSSLLTSIILHIRLKKTLLQKL